MDGATIFVPFATEYGTMQVAKCNQEHMGYFKKCAFFAWTCSQRDCVHLYTAHRKQLPTRTGSQRVMDATRCELMDWLFLSHCCWLMVPLKYKWFISPVVTFECCLLWLSWVTKNCFILYYIKTTRNSSSMCPFLKEKHGLTHFPFLGHIFWNQKRVHYVFLGKMVSVKLCL